MGSGAFRLVSYRKPLQLIAQAHLTNTTKNNTNNYQTLLIIRPAASLQLS